MNTLAIRSARLGRWLLCALIGMLSSAAGALPVNSFTVTVPHRTGLGQLELSAIKITVQLDSSANIKLSVSEAGSGTLETAVMNLASAGNDCFGGVSCFSDLPNLPGGGAVQKDRLTVIKPLQTGADPGSTANDKVVLILRLKSNLNEASACASTMAAGETWTVSVVGGLARITGVSVQSLDKQTVGAGNPACGTAFRPVPLNDGPLATVGGQPAILAGGRVGVDAVMVLDRSGSMSDPVSGGGGAPSKMTRLGQATDTFIDMWAALRANECQNFAVSCPAIGGLPPIQGPVDRLGVVFFDDAFSWLKTLQPGSAIDGLKDFSTLNLVTEKTAIKAVSPNGWTSIGGGLKLAAPALAPALSEPNRKVILLMTDGQQNTDPLVQVAGSQVQTTLLGVPTNLANQPPIQIYGVTVGTGVAVDATVNQTVANASNGFYLNTEDDAAILPNLFVQVLQNAVKYSSVETLRVIADKTRFVAPFTTSVPVTSTTHSLAFNLTWNPQQGSMSVRLTPPAGGAPIDFIPATQSTPGLLTGNVAFPRNGVPVTAGPWTVRISTTNDGIAGVPFNFTLLGDDVGISSFLGPQKADYAVGGTITLRAQVNDLEAPLAGLGSQPGAQVQVFVVRPGVSVGDVLSDTAASPAPPGAADTATAAQRKLQAILAANPNALVTANDIVTLTDSGDTGLYSATIPAAFEGHYNFVYLVEGTSAAGGRFVRQQIRTVHVRSLPDAGSTQATTSVVTLASGSVLVATITPRNVNNGKMGPGWANYFWFNRPGAPPVKPVDNLDGTYTAQIPFAGATPPVVSVHFLPEPVWRPDSFVPAPGQLSPGNQVIPDVTHPPGGGGAGGRAVWLALGTTIPSGSFGNAYDRDFAGNLGLEFPITPALAVEATLGLHQFKGQGGAPDLDVTQYGVNGKWYVAGPPFKPFVTLGLGGYSFDPGSNRFGVNAGAGVQVDVAPRWSIEGRYTYHSISGNSPNSHYSTLLIGVRYAF